ncbi:uncharacterized protein EV422DRAFT_571596 [Fimicolochytrium jonesii]|uniref:uncharacterized protein n=1 Tax=Fimicolochytrium jonesii TaxID=1396493 RepID=UPI0022FEE216|nr:uncharacterized protein EV422DRAFT_571596 [Fimicolochytrium jonesii]KAI8816626.1 hypothetical protein EV422DRAFT_571596 [Fimicolochytrium jonesii]
MQNPAKDFIPLILDPMLSTDLTTLNRTVDNYIADDMVFHHPAFHVEGKEEVRKLYTTWSWANRRFGELRINAFWYDEVTNRVVTDIDYQLQPTFFLPTAEPQLARVITIFHLRAVPTSTGVLHYLTRQEDYYPTDSIVAACTPQPFSRFSKSLANLILRLDGLFMIYILSHVLWIVSAVHEALGWKKSELRGVKQIVGVDGKTESVQERERMLRLLGSAPKAAGDGAAQRKARLAVANGAARPNGI